MVKPIVQRLCQFINDTFARYIIRLIANANVHMSIKSSVVNSESVSR